MAALPIHDAPFATVFYASVAAEIATLLFQCFSVLLCLPARLTQPRKLFIPH